MCHICGGSTSVASMKCQLFYEDCGSDTMKPKPPNDVASDLIQVPERFQQDPPLHIRSEEILHCDGWVPSVNAFLDLCNAG